jgi:hypothetical protein
MTPEAYAIARGGMEVERRGRRSSSMRQYRVRGSGGAPGMPVVSCVW